MKKILPAALLLLILAPNMGAQNQKRSEQYKLRLAECEKMVPRLSTQPVKSCKTNTGAEPMDTVDTPNENIKVVLYSDNTWKYVKLREFRAQEDIFTKNWETTLSDPYNIEYKDMPASWTIWLVDSLGQYHVPYQGEVNPRGKFGPRRGRRHQGIDLPLKTGEKIYATFDGKVRVSRYAKGYGNLVVIRHDNGLETFYGHLSERKVESGDWVKAGDVIGLGGSTGRSTGPHLHFETRYQGYAFDPQWLIDFPNDVLRHRLFVLKKKYFSPYSNYEQDFDDEEKNAEEDAKADAEEAAKKYYKVRAGDTLGRIAQRNGTTVKALCKLNNMKDTDILREGRTIRVR